MRGVNGRQSVLTRTGLRQGKKLATILVAVDGSQPSLTAATVAMQITGGLPVAVNGLYIIDQRLITNPYASFQRELGFEADPDSNVDLIELFQRRGDITLHWLEDLCRIEQVPVTTKMFFGGVSETVLKQAEQAQLLVVGRRGVGHDADPKHLGRNYRDIARHARIPLLIGGSLQRPVRRILFAHDSSDDSQRALSWATYLQQILDSQLIVLTVTNSNGQSPAPTISLQNQLKRCAIDNYRLVSRLGRPSDQIAAAANENQVDLIVMGPYNHAAWLDRLFGRTVNRTLLNTDLPVLVA